MYELSLMMCILDGILEGQSLDKIQGRVGVMDIG